MTEAQDKERALQVRAERQRVRKAAYAVYPERFVQGLPTETTLPDAVWINKPKTENPSQQILP